MTHFTATDEPKGPYRWVVLCGVWLIYFSFGLTVAALGPLVTPITDDLNMTFGEMGTVLGAWPLVYIHSFNTFPCSCYFWTRRPFNFNWRSKSYCTFISRKKSRPGDGNLYNGSRSRRRDSSLNHQ